MIKHNEIEIVDKNPFANCQLDRKKYADILTNIVTTYPEGFVMSINNKWGTGKTTFIRMWEQDLKQNGFQTVLFNAWENDFENNPLTALMGELKTLTKKNVENPHFENALKNAATFTKNLAPVLVKAVVKKYIGESYEDLAEGATNSLADIFERDVNEYADKKKNIFDFKESLKKFIADTNQGKPLVFIVDELDRCRPDYAVSILEQIKHFFSIPNIVFVLSIDKEQLGHAIRGVYGSEKIDTDEYLRRFIDIEYSIPEPDNEKFVKYLYNYYNFDEFFSNELRLQAYELKNDKEDFLIISTILFKNSKLSLRQQDKIMAHSRLVLKSFGYNYYVYPAAFVFIIYLRVINLELYQKVKSKEINLNELLEEFYSIVKYNYSEDHLRRIIYMESFLAFLYNNYLYPNSNSKSLISKDPHTNEITVNIVSKTDTSEGKIHFQKSLDYFYREFYGSGEFLNNVLDKIDLLEGFKQ